MARPPKSTALVSRDRVFAAAAAEFAARGFAGANVDRIARAAHVNKAMIYYHFKSKAALYQEILGDMFHAVGERLGAVVASDATAPQKLAQFVDGDGDLSDRIVDAKPFEKPWSKNVQLRTEQVEAMQKTLTERGLYRDKVDGKAGMLTRAALGEYQKANGLKLDCWPTAAVLTHMQARR